jgi:hypothetical protein
MAPASRYDGILSKNCVWAVAVLLAAGIQTAVANAGSITYRNDTKIAVVVQGLSIINNRVIQGPVHILQPGQAAADRILVPGNKLIIVADAKQPTRILYRDTQLIGAGDFFFGIEAEEPAKGVKPGKITRVKLVPSSAAPVPMKPPAPPSRR